MDIDPTPEADLPEEKQDASHDLDLVTVFEEIGSDAEMGALSVRGMLESAGFEAVLVGSSVLPNLAFQVRVPKTQAEEARRLITEAETAAQTETRDE